MEDELCWPLQASNRALGRVRGEQGGGGRGVPEWGDGERVEGGPGGGKERLQEAGLRSGSYAGSKSHVPGCGKQLLAAPIFSD